MFNREKLEQSTQISLVEMYNARLIRSTSTDFFSLMVLEDIRNYFVLDEDEELEGCF